MNKVQVLLSSYNGEKYIKEQIDSIFNQKGVEVFCLVRDDGSVDNTINILNECKKTYKNLEVIEGENIGYKESFMELVRKAGKYDYYAFSDQDDVWKGEKLLKAIEKINTVKAIKPVLYCSNCIVVDEKLNYLSMLYNHNNILPDNKYKALVQGFAYGCTMVFNYEAVKMILKHKPKGEYAHDFWIPILITFLGEVIYDENSYILYRQHGSNALGSGRSIWKIISIKLKQIKKSSLYSEMINGLLSGYDELLKIEDKKMLEDILKYKKSIYYKWKLISNKNLRKNTLKGTLFLKIMILISKF